MWIFINILVVIAIIYLLLVLVDVIFVSSFITIFKKHDHDLTVVLNTKYDNVLKLFNIMQALDVEVNPKYIEMLKNITPEDMNNKNSERCKIARENLTYLCDEALFIATKNKWLENNQDFLIAKNNVSELDYVYRNHVAMYNADVLGYNYWIRFFPTRFIYKLLKFKPKKII